MSNLSILWSPTDARAAMPETQFLHDLHADDLIHLSPRRIGESVLPLSDYLTCDPDTMRLRTAMFWELLENPALFDALSDCFSRLWDIFDLQDARGGVSTSAGTEQLLYSIREMESYIDYLNRFKAVFSEHTVQSQLLSELWQAVAPLCTGDDYDALCEAVKKQSHTIQNIRSVSVGINLDPTLRPIEAGVLAVHDQSYVSGDAISHLLRLNFHKDDFTCSAPLYPASRRLTPQEQAALQESVNTALNKIFGDSLKSWASVIRSHVMSDLRALAPLAEEWRFVTAAMEPLCRLRRAGCTLCTPTIADAGADERIEGLYHPLLALSADISTLVRNELTFDTGGRLFVLTGPNSGGKSVYLQAVGLCYTMLHLGLPIPADKAALCPTDAILTHFADAQGTSFRHGRLGIECERIHAINRMVTKNSLVLFDEALSGTNATEATVISTEVLAAYATIGARGVWVTHLYDLCRLSDTLGDTASRVTNLTARLDPASHNRLYVVVRGDGTAQSYAMDIARSFHLTREEILEAR